MDYCAIIAIFSIAFMASSLASPVPEELTNLINRPVVAVRMGEPKPVGTFPPPAAERRQGLGMGMGGMGGLGGLGHLLGSGLGFGWSDKMPFDYIAGPYRSSLQMPAGYRGMDLEQFGISGAPFFGQGPMGGVMGVPLAMLLG